MQASEDKRVKDDSIPHIGVSWGELVDKITILEIKSNKLTNETALENVKRELDLIYPNYLSILNSVKALESLKAELSSVNSELWVIEDQIREKERSKEFDQSFIDLARSVYFKNDKRAEIKRKINVILNSEIIEEKSYKSY